MGWVPSSFFWRLVSVYNIQGGKNSERNSQSYRLVELEDSGQMQPQESKEIPGKSQKGRAPRSECELLKSLADPSAITRADWEAHLRLKEWNWDLWCYPRDRVSSSNATILIAAKTNKLNAECLQLNIAIIKRQTKLPDKERNRKMWPMFWEGNPKVAYVLELADEYLNRLF